jgi:peptide chain release factor 2
LPVRDLSDDLRGLRRRLAEAETYLDLEGRRKRLAELEAEVGRPDLWDNTEQAAATTREYGQVKADVDEMDALDARLSDTETLHELAVEENDETVAGELSAAVQALTADLERLELRSLFTGEHDERFAVCEIHAKDGGTDAQDWAEMMLRMYQRWAERRGFEMEIDEVSPGQEAGILSATFIIKGRYGTGLLASERGVHRLVRISPFDSQARRQTSFASMSVVPLLEASDEVEIDEKDLRIDTYRSSGAGGQHVNVTDSAVRITHLPTGIVVSVQNERSQHQNKAKAMQILGAKLADRQREERAASLEAMAGPKAQIGWGAQIRSYVLAPYQLVKDLRTDYETGNVQAVLDGDLDGFIEAYLRWRRAQQAAGGAT